MSPLALSGAFLAALAALSPPFAAQAHRLGPRPVSGALHHATLDLGTGEITRDSEDKAAGLITIWANTDWSGFYSTPYVPGEEWLDWGAISTTSGSDIIGSYEFAYATTVLDTTVGGPGARLCTNFYDDAVGWCTESGLGIMPDASFCYSGLPGSTSGSTGRAWVITVDLIGGAEFMQDAGPFGYAMEFFEVETGPLLCYAGSIGGFADANGQIDVMDIYSPDVSSGTCGSYSFGGLPYNFTSWWLRIEAADASGGPPASCGFYCGTGVNANGFTVASGPVLGGTFVGSVVAAGPNTSAFLAGYATPLTYSTPWGELLVNIGDPGGELLGLPAAFGDPAIIPVPVPINLALAGAAFHVQAAGFGGGVQLHCAYACTLGF